MQKVLGLATLPKSTATMKNKLHKFSTPVIGTPVPIYLL